MEHAVAKYRFGTLSQLDHGRRVGRYLDHIKNFNACGHTDVDTMDASAF